jgi:hypothetical protein
MVQNMEVSFSLTSLTRLTCLMAVAGDKRLSNRSRQTIEEQKMNDRIMRLSGEYATRQQYWEKITVALHGLEESYISRVRILLAELGEDYAQLVRDQAVEICALRGRLAKYEPENKP